MSVYTTQRGPNTSSIQRARKAGERPVCPQVFRTSLTDPQNLIPTAYNYDTLNRLQGILLNGHTSPDFSFGYDQLSRRNSLTRPNGINTSYAYDQVSRLLSVTHALGATTVDGASYTYDNAGNRKTRTDLRTGTALTYGYDNIYQLLSVKQGTTAKETYTYDLVGNRLTSKLGSNPTVTYTPNTSNELTATNPGVSYNYDHNGNLTSKTDGTGYTWDAENRLTQVTLPSSGGTVNFKYDPFGRRVQKSFTNGSGTTVTDYLHDGDRLLEEVDNSGNVLARYTHGLGIDQPLAELRSATMSYYEQDGLGSVSSVSNASGALANTYSYDSYGNLMASGGTTINPFRYTARELDSETGVYDYRARYYDPYVGRFISGDPTMIGINFYAYVINNPAVFVDPFGLRNCTNTPLGLVCYPDSNPGTIQFDPHVPTLPTPPGLPQMPTPVPMPGTLCEPGTDCHDRMQGGIPMSTAGGFGLNPCQGWDFDSVSLPFRGPYFECSGDLDKCLDAESRFVKACAKAGCVGKTANTKFGGVGAACCQKQ